VLALLAPSDGLKVVASPWPLVAAASAISVIAAAMGSGRDGTAAVALSGKVSSAVSEAGSLFSESLANAEISGVDAAGTALAGAACMVPGSSNAPDKAAASADAAASAPASLALCAAVAFELPGFAAPGWTSGAAAVVAASAKVGSSNGAGVVESSETRVAVAADAVLPADVAAGSVWVVTVAAPDVAVGVTVGTVPARSEAMSGA
jgi:hypothetical protein